MTLKMTSATASRSTLRRCAVGSRRAVSVLLPIVLSAGMLAAQGPASKSLEIYVIDTEGGKATLYVAPGGQTVLVDSGNPGGRDTDRIMAALSDAGATKIDYLVSTHYHVDHVGGLQELAGRIPIGTFVDHGATVEGPVTALREQVPGFQVAYAALHAKAKHLVVKAGDRLPVTGLDWRIVSSAGEVLKTPLPGAGKPNPECTGFTNAIDATTWRDPEDDQSVGSLVTLGKFRMIDLADLLWDKAVAMMCPSNTIGDVDLYLVTGHGADVCSADPLVHTLHPRAAVMYNGTRKGGGVIAMEGVWRSPGLEDFWQLHWSYNGGLELNSAGLFIANMDDPATIAGILTAPPQGRGRGVAAHTPAYWIKVSAQPDGTFTIANTRNGFSKTYVTRAK